MEGKRFREIVPIAAADDNARAHPCEPARGSRRILPRAPSCWHGSLRLEWCPAPRQTFDCWSSASRSKSHWAAEETGLEANKIVSFARAYASTRPAMILLGGSSMHKGANGWH